MKVIDALVIEAVKHQQRPMKLYRFVRTGTECATACPVNKGVRLGSVACSCCKHHGYTSYRLGALACSRPGLIDRIVKAVAYVRR